MNDNTNVAIRCFYSLVSVLMETFIFVANIKAAKTLSLGHGLMMTLEIFGEVIDIRKYTTTSLHRSVNHVDPTVQIIKYKWL
jgi:hypothetical protein